MANSTASKRKWTSSSVLLLSKKKISCLRQTKTQINDFFFEKAKMEYIKQLNGELGNSIINIKIYNK